MGQILYLECSSGISGDMTAGALLDLGADREAVRRALESVPGGGFRTEIGRVKKAGIDCCDFRVILDAEHENHDHDMEYLHGHEHGGAAASGHGHEHEHEHEHGGSVAGGHEHGHEHEHGGAPHGHEHGHHHEHRSFADVREILAAVDMTERARELALRIFTILAEAEAKAHAVPVDEVHFHEVGAIDSIVDIVTAAVCFDSLGVSEVAIPHLCEGSGTVRCQHGILPIPVPAVANIAAACSLPLRFTGVQGELVTPTGAAIAGAIRTTGVLPETFSIKKIGIGAGKRSYERPSLLRAMLIEAAAEQKSSGGAEKKLGERGTCAENGKAGQAEEHGACADNCETGQLWKLETNIDDSTGEELGFAMERLFEAGARDVFFTPIFMKKNRPAHMLSVICTEERRRELEAILFAETTTIGVRRIALERTALPRRQRFVRTPFGTAEVKVAQTPDGERFYPEYECAADLARRNGVPLQEVYRAIAEAAGEPLTNSGA